MPRLAEVISVLEGLYDPSIAESWDAVGLVCGDPDANVDRVLFAVDPVDAIVDEAFSWGADLIVTHHPLLLRPVNSVAATSVKGRLVHRLISNGVALFTAHTNADSADPGVSDALAAAIGLTDTAPLQPIPDHVLDKLVVFVPEPDAQRLLDALAGAGAGSLGSYDRCAWSVAGTGTFRPLAGAQPAIGKVGSIEVVPEIRLEMVVPRLLRTTVVRALRAAHPYEEPAFDLYELAAQPGGRGLGRIGRLPEPESLAALTERISGSLPATVAGVRAAGHPRRLIENVAVCGGAGDSLIETASRSGAQAFVTADLRHHPTAEAGDLALVDVSHWASEWPWLADAAQRLVTDLSVLDSVGPDSLGLHTPRHDTSRPDTTVETRVSTICTDPWTLHIG